MSYANSRKAGASGSVKTWVFPDFDTSLPIPATVVICEATGLTSGFLYQFQVGLKYDDLVVNESYIAVLDSFGANIRTQACFSNAGIQNAVFDQQVLIPFICPAGETEVSVEWVNQGVSASGQFSGDNIRIIELGRIIV
jgi:hypothetical protein